QSDILAIRDDPSTIWLVDELPQAAQAPAQCGPGIIRNGPEHGAEPVAAVRTRRDREIGEERPRLFRRRQLHSRAVALHSKIAQHGNAQQLIRFHARVLSRTRMPASALPKRRVTAPSGLGFRRTEM